MVRFFVKLESYTERCLVQQAVMTTMAINYYF